MALSLLVGPSEQDWARRILPFRGVGTHEYNLGMAGSLMPTTWSVHIADTIAESKFSRQVLDK